MGPWLIGYGIFLLGLFTLCKATLGFGVTILGFMVTFAVCSLVTFVFWWQDEQLWQETRQMEQEPTPVVSSFLSSPVTHEPIIPQSIQPQQEHLSFDDNEFDLLETYTQDITQRVEAVYPLVDREHVHKIVWTVMVELFCKHGDPFARTAPTPVITEKMAQAVEHVA